VSAAAVGTAVEEERALATGHRQINLRQQMRVQQGAMELALRVVDVVALAQVVQSVLLAGMQLARQRHRIGDGADVLQLLRKARARELSIEKAEIERRVVDQQLRAFQVIPQRARDLRELRLVGEESAGDAMDRLGAGLAGPLRIDVTVKVVLRRPPVLQLDAADLDHAVALRDFEAGGFGIEDDLPLHAIFPMPSLASWSAFSLPGSPA
jgi:CBS domain-containing protein